MFKVFGICCDNALSFRVVSYCRKVLWVKQFLDESSYAENVLRKFVVSGVHICLRQAVQASQAYT